MITKQTLIKFGLTEDNNNLKLKEVFKDNIIKEIHIDLYSENPFIASTEAFMLLSRIIEKKIKVKNNGDRLIFKKTIDNFDTHLMDVPFSKITDCHYKTFNNYFEFILNIQNIYYRIIVFN